jgi:hypothetical protein
MQIDTEHRLEESSSGREGKVGMRESRYLSAATSRILGLGKKDGDAFNSELIQTETISDI